MELRTSRLLLRRARAGDLDDLHAILSDPVAMRYWATEAHGDKAETAEWLGRMIAAPTETSDDFVVVLGDRVIGKMGSYHLPELGLIFARDTWGHGYAFEAGTAVIAHIAKRGLDHLHADVDPRNTGSLKALLRLGFVETHRVRNTWFVNNEWCDSVYLRYDFKP